MGIDIEAYRLRVGLHAARAPRARRGKTGACDDFAHGPMGVPFTSELETDSASLRPRVYMSRCRRSSAVQVLLVSGLATLMLLACVLKPDSPPKNLQDLSELILLSGSVEPNPGPGSGSQGETGSDIEDVTETTTTELGRRWETRLEEHMTATQMKLAETETELEEMKTWMQTTNDQNRQHLQQALDSFKNLQTETEYMKIHLNNLYTELQKKTLKIDSEIENLEAVTRCNGIRLFGVHEDRRESYWSCVQLVLRLFRETVPGVTWSEKDITRVQRLGPPIRSKSQKPRPVLVQLTTFQDKMMLLKSGRNPMGHLGVKISGELTSRQARTLRDLRRQGHHAFYRNSKLCFREEDRSTSYSRQQYTSRNQSASRNRPSTKPGTETWRTASQDARQHQDFQVPTRSYTSFVNHYNDATGSAPFAAPFSTTREMVTQQSSPQRPDCGACEHALQTTNGHPNTRINSWRVPPETSHNSWRVPTEMPQNSWRVPPENSSRVPPETPQNSWRVSSEASTTPAQHQFHIPTLPETNFRTAAEVDRQGSQDRLARHCRSSETYYRRKKRSNAGDNKSAPASLENAPVLKLQPQKMHLTHDMRKTDSLQLQPRHDELQAPHPKKNPKSQQSILQWLQTGQSKSGRGNQPENTTRKVDLQNTETDFPPVQRETGVEDRPHEDSGDEEDEDFISVVEDEQSSRPDLADMGPPSIWDGRLRRPLNPAHQKEGDEPRT